MRLSVVIPTFNRRAKLGATLDALAGQALGAHEAEVIVVDSGSSDGTPDAVRERAAGYPLPLRVLVEPHGGVSGSRNAGLGEARHPIVLFIGDDTRPAGAGFLAGHAAAHEELGDVGVLGRAAWAPELEITPLMRWLEHGPQSDYPALEHREPGPEHLYTTNVSLPRERVLAAGGFDERIALIYEDIELGARLIARGLRLVYRPELLVHHDHPITLASWERRQRIAGASGRVLNERIGGGSALVPVPGGPSWAAARLLCPVARRLPREGAWLPRHLRERAYAAVHFGAYAAGYREASASP